MFNLFKRDKTPDVKEIRNSLLQFIKEQLQKSEGGEARNIRGLFLYITCEPSEKHLYEAAVFADEKDHFKNDEVQRIADDYAIALPSNWTLEIIFETAPPEAIAARNINASLFISTRNKPVVHKNKAAYLRILNGQAEKEVYVISSGSGKTNIGREKKVQAADGFFRENIIAFIGNDESNKSVSRQHAHIQWDGTTGSFCLYADEGGIPPRNKTKVRNVQGEIIKIQTTEIGHNLQEGDQVMLGESAVMAFAYHQGENT